MNSATTNRSYRPRLTHAALLIALVLFGLGWGSNAQAIGAHSATGAGVYGESGLASVDDVTGAARYAVEVNQGWFASHGVEVGDKVEGLDALPR